MSLRDSAITLRRARNELNFALSAILINRRWRIRLPKNVHAVHQWGLLRVGGGTLRPQTLLNTNSGDQ